MSYCFYEILDNVLTHSEKELGTVFTHYDSTNHILSFLVADDGIGVQASLSENTEYAGISEPDALKICIKDAITDGKGMGFGLYSTSLLARDAGLVLLRMISVEDCVLLIWREKSRFYIKITFSLGFFRYIQQQQKNYLML